MKFNFFKKKEGVTPLNADKKPEQIKLTFNGFVEKFSILAAQIYKMKESNSSDIKIAEISKLFNSFETRLKHTVRGEFSDKEYNHLLTFLGDFEAMLQRDPNATSNQMNGILNGFSEESGEENIRELFERIINPPQERNDAPSEKTSEDKDIWGEILD